jgi:hypothetical protein
MYNPDEVKIKTEQVEMKESQEEQEAQTAFESPETAMAEAEKAVENFKQQGQKELAPLEARAAAEGLVIEEADKTALEGVGQDAEQAKKYFVNVVGGEAHTCINIVNVKVDSAENGNRDQITLSEEEIEEAVAGFIEDLNKCGQQVDQEKVNGLKDWLKKGEDSEAIEDFISSNPQYFRADRLAQIAVSNPEIALRYVKSKPDKDYQDIIGVLAERKEIAQLAIVLGQYKQNEARFENTVKRIEAILSGSDLMKLSNTMKADEGLEERIVDHEDAMKKEKHTTRPLEEYKKNLRISQQSLEQLNNEQLLLIGGGFSPIKKALSEKEIECTVTNIDPIAKGDSSGADITIAKDFFETSVEEGKYKEIWALHSLPTYAFNPEQVRDFYSKSLLTLRENGILRVTPVDKFGDSFGPSMRLSRKPVNEASVEFINRLGQRPDLFELAHFSVEKQKNKMSPGGKKSEMTGVTIKIIGDKNQVEEFLKDYQ